jgi:hypothetical protein
MKNSLRSTMAALVVVGGITMASAQLSAQQPDSQRDTTQQQMDQLPQTAGPSALLALLGLGSISGAVALRKVRRA